MYRPLLSVASAALVALGCQNAPPEMNATALAPPVAAKKPFEITTHGHTRTDEYHWMRLSEEQRNAKEPDAHTREVVAHLDAENAYCETMMAPVKQLREELFKELRARIKETDLSVPYRENGYWYHSRYEEGKEYAVQVRRKDLPGAPEEDFLDENKLAVGTTYYDLGDFEISPKNNLVCYSEDRVGRRQYELRFKDLNTGAGDLAAPQGAEGGVAAATALGGPPYRYALLAPLLLLSAAFPSHCAFKQITTPLHLAASQS